MNTGRLGQNLIETVYVKQPNHRFLGDDSFLYEDSNIGINGENLTVSFLSMNRSALSIKLCSSIACHIPDFKGELLVIDNGSTDGELRALENHLQTMPYRWRVVRLGSNYGVSGGRNRMVENVNTPWVMSLDNAMRFIKNPLPQFQHDIAQLGCHFLAPTILDVDEQTTWLRGGNLYLDHIQDALVIGGGSCYLMDKPYEHLPPFLCTFMSGAAGIFRCDTFKLLGGFDENMFVGFEDTELSLRIFRSGLKIGASNIAALVHDHPKPTTEEDINYEKIRFARKEIRESAEYFERKHGYKVWTVNAEEWLEQRREQLGISAAASEINEHTPNVPNSATARDQIVLFIDVVGWALDNVALQIQRHLSDEFEIEILPTSQMSNPAIGLSLAADAKLVHFLWRGPLFDMCQNHSDDSYRHLFGGYDDFLDKFKNLPITFSVFDHLFLDDVGVEKIRSCFAKMKVMGYTVSSMKLTSIYEHIGGLEKPSAVTQDGVDLNIFRPKNLARFKEVGVVRPIRVGWVGNSAFGHWNETGAKEDLKGLHSIIMPMIEELRVTGYPVEVYFADRQVEWIPHQRMPEYYSKIDVLLCASLSEGTPNPVLEAMACGVPVISTNVGIVSEVFGAEQRKYIANARSVDSLKECLLRLINAPENLHTLSSENIRQIEAWDWKKRVESYRVFFRKMIEAAKEPLQKSSY